MKGNLPIIILVVVIIIALVSNLKNGVSNTGQQNNGMDFLGGNYSGETGATTTANNTKTKEQIEYELQDAQNKANELSRQVAIEQEIKNSSIYKDKIYFSGGYGYGADMEYVEISANPNNKESIKITGWTITSTSTGQTVNIPKSTSLYFANSINSEEDVYLKPGEKALVITGRSPIGHGLKVNKCSGYLAQKNTFYPGLWSNCPMARNEDLSSIPKTPTNDNCFNLIDSFPTCSTQETALSNFYSSECQNFIYTKMNYPNCINTHKNDKDFWGTEWRIYLKRSEKLWKDRRETIILYDEFNKPIGKIQKY